MTKTVLLVEDSATEQEIIADCLREAGYLVSLAADGDEVSSQIATRQVDLVVLDIIMPRVSGYEVCRHLKNDPSTKHIPIIMLTNKTTAPDEYYGKRLGANIYLKKPFKPAALLAEVRKLI